jgi:hypothetical protein
MFSSPVDERFAGTSNISLSFLKRGQIDYKAIVFRQYGAQSFPHIFFGLVQVV